jgi:transposase-like protein
VKVAGRWTYLYRVIDQYGPVIDVLLSDRRDLAAARRFFTRALHAATVPAEVTTDRAPAYPRVLDEADHGTLKSRVRPMRGLKRRRSAHALNDRSANLRRRFAPTHHARPVRQNARHGMAHSQHEADSARETPAA